MTAAKVSFLDGAERWTLGGVLLLIAVLKFVPAHDGGHIGHGGLDVLLRRGAIAMWAIEASLGVLLLTPEWRRGALVSVLVWSSISGMALTALFLNVPLEGCGCLGPFSMPAAGRVAISTGLALLSVRVACMDACARE